ncbi:MAG: hypothetical protein JWM82_2255 [Myxococcales bacterium]|nr:hypothetical protein [Myxococcales bacterium]
MQLMQIAISPDGAYIYALDVQGALWVARTRVEGFDGGAMDAAPTWVPVKPPPGAPVAA